LEGLAALENEFYARGGNEGLERPPDENNEESEESE
jgi:hypothetical protein